MDDAGFLRLGDFKGEREFDGADEVILELVEEDVLDIGLDADFHLFAQFLAEFFDGGKAEAFEEVLVDGGEFEFFDVADGEVEIDFLAADFFDGVIVRCGDFERAGFVDFSAGESCGEVFDFDARDVSGSDDDLCFFLVSDEFIAEFEFDGGGDEVFFFDAASVGGDERTLLLAEVLHGLLDVFVGDGDDGSFDGQA